MIHHSIRREKKKKLIHTQTRDVGERKTMRRMGVKGRAVTRLKAEGENREEKNTSNFPNPSGRSPRTKILADGEGNKKTRRSRRKKSSGSRKGSGKCATRDSEVCWFDDGGKGRASAGGRGMRRTGRGERGEGTQAGRNIGL